MNKLWFASLFTLSVMFSFVFFVIILILLYLEEVSLGLAIGLTIVVNILFWLIGPVVTDFINKHFYKAVFLTPEALAASHPEVAEIIATVSKEYGFKQPKVGLIPDQNPTAFTYGSGRYNARIVVTEGIFKYLNEDEVKAVVAHEMGHVVNRDFIVMMVGSTLVQILYEIYATLIRARGKRSGGIKAVALVSYALYLVAIYLLYYLSRTREYLADEFASKKTNPGSLATALIKIAYGVVASEDTEASKRLLHSTRHLGLIDVKNARSLGVVSRLSQADPQVISEVLVFDKVNPWAKLTELTSTHPLTGKRLNRLGEMVRARGEVFLYDVDAAILRMKPDRGRLWTNFWRDLIIGGLPMGLAFAALILAPISWVLVGYGIGMLLILFYRYPQGKPVVTTLLNELRDPYASPVKGKAVLIGGTVIGRGMPGYVLGEDMMFQDPTGLIFLNYQSALGFLGNWFFALKKIKTLFGKPAKVTGWFYRSLATSMTLKELTTETGVVKSHPMLWQAIIASLLIFIGIIFT